MKKIEITSWGSDPEYAVIDNNGEVVIVNDLLPGSKQEPYDIKDGIAVQPDGVAIEMTIPPCYSKEEFVTVMLKAREVADEVLAKINPDYKTATISSATYPLELLEKYPKCLEFGCSVSYCAWTGGETFVPSAEEVGKARSFGK